MSYLKFFYEVCTALCESFVIPDLSFSRVEEASWISRTYRDVIFVLILGRIGFSVVAKNEQRSDSVDGERFQCCPRRDEINANAPHIRHAILSYMPKIFVDNVFAASRLQRVSTPSQELVLEDVVILSIENMWLGRVLGCHVLGQF